MASLGEFKLDVRGALRTSRDDDLFRDQVENTLRYVGNIKRDDEILWAGTMVIYKWSGTVKNIMDMEKMIRRLRVLGGRYMRAMTISLKISLTETAMEI